MAPSCALRRPVTRSRPSQVLTVLVVLAGLAVLAFPHDVAAQGAGDRTAPDGGAGATSWVPEAQRTPAASSTYAFGQVPLADSLYWAGQKAACGLTTNQLAALMLAPTYPETGASGLAAPSPMTLSRWDTGAGLYAFGSKATAYQKAFWHPGVGAWAFDSAGGWNLNAAQAMSTDTAAQQAATTMASRWCASSGTDAQRRQAAWGPWFGCSNGVCETIYNAIYDPTTLNVYVDPAVGRLGGAEARACSVPSLGTVPCTFVDPGRAEGYKAWTIPAWGPSPVSAPFYDFTASGREYRVWLHDDTGYAVTVNASKLVTANARTSLTWTAGDALCDLTLGRGSCPEARVATTPWGPKTANPFGSLDSASPRAGSIRVSGWAVDPDTNSPVTVHFYVDGQWGGAFSADRDRPDVGAAVPGYGTSHGFAESVTPVGGGSHQICAYAINLGPFGSTNPLLGCATVVTPANPFGNVDSLSVTSSGIAISGWAIDPDSTGPDPVHIYVDGRWGAATSASTSRPDVGASYPGYGNAHGFAITLSISSGTHQICAFGINVGPGTTNPLLACQSITVPPMPFGNIDLAVRSGDQVRIAGWALDPKTPTSITVSVSVNGQTAVATPAGLNRPDVGAAYPGFGANHGWDLTFAVAPGPISICVSGLNSVASAPPGLIGCVTR